MNTARVPWAVALVLVLGCVSFADGDFWRGIFCLISAIVILVYDATK